MSMLRGQAQGVTEKTGDNGGDDVTHSGGGTGVGTMKALHYGQLCRPQCLNKVFDIKKYSK